MKRIYLFFFLLAGVGVVCTKDKNPLVGATDRVVIKTLTPASLTDSSAIFGGEITSTGGTQIRERGFCWATTDSPTVQDSTVVVNDTIGSFFYGPRNLLPNKIYYFRAYAKNPSGTIYANTLNFRTLAGLPRLTTSAASNVTNISAQAGGVIVSDGGSTIIDKGICVSSVNPLPTTADTVVSAGAGVSNYTTTISNLLGNRRYYVRAFARNPQGLQYAINVVQFITSSPQPPIMSQVTVSNVTRNTAQFAGSVTSNQGALITEYGFCYGGTPNPTIANGRIQYFGNINTAFTSSVSGLVAGTTYYVRAYAYNGAGGPSYSAASATFTTSPMIPPSVVTTGSSSVSYTSATLSGSVTDDGGGAVTERGFYYSSTGTPTTASPSVIAPGTGVGAFSASLTGLPVNTVYNFVAYAKNSSGIRLSTTILSFRTLTPSMPTVVTTGSSSVSFTTASMSGNITSDGGAAVTERGFYYSSTGTPTTSSPSVIAPGTGVGAFSASLSGLTTNTLYNFVAYAKNISGTRLSSTVLSFRTLTLNPPTLTTTAASNITTTSFQSGGNITADGGAPIIERGICWNTTGSPTIANSRTIDGSGTGSFSSIASPLTSYTTYYVRAYAINSGGSTGYGNQITVQTNLSAPTLTSPANGVTLPCCNQWFNWSAVPGATSYEFQVSKSSTFSFALGTLPVCGSGSMSATNVNRSLPTSNSFCVGMGSSTNIGTWYWRVRAVAGTNVSNWSATRNFYYPF
jgi:hypothetical protein